MVGLTSEVLSAHDRACWGKRIVDAGTACRALLASRYCQRGLSASIAYLAVIVQMLCERSTACGRVARWLYDGRRQGMGDTYSSYFGTGSRKSPMGCASITRYGIILMRLVPRRTGFLPGSGR